MHPVLNLQYLLSLIFALKSPGSNAKVEAALLSLHSLQIYPSSLTITSLWFGTFIF